MCECGNMCLCVLGRGLETKKVQYLLQKKNPLFYLPAWILTFVSDWFAISDGRNSGSMVLKQISVLLWLSIVTVNLELFYMNRFINKDT